MPVLSGNSCQIITLFPMGVECSVTNAYTPFTNDGAISLTITGGTAPYSISWSNGSTNQNITNLQYGDYTATVVDYYGDFSATTTCTVEFDSFYLQKFENCFPYCETGKKLKNSSLVSKVLGSHLKIGITSWKGIKLKIALGHLY